MPVKNIRQGWLRISAACKICLQLNELTSVNFVSTSVIVATFLMLIGQYLLSASANVIPLYNHAVKLLFSTLQLS